MVCLDATFSAASLTSLCFHELVATNCVAENDMSRALLWVALSPSHFIFGKSFLISFQIRFDFLRICLSVSFVFSVDSFTVSLPIPLLRG